MKTSQKTLKNFYLLFICVLAFINNVDAQDYSINQTVNYINKIFDNPKYEISFSDNKFIIKDYDTKSGSLGGTKELHISDIWKVTVGEGNQGDYSCNSCVFIRRLDDKNPNMFHLNPFLIICKNSSDAEKISNAIRYIIDKVGKSTVDNDPYSSYSVEQKDNSTININDLYVGMSKEIVFKTLNTKPIVDLIEDGYKVYKVKKNMDQYFIYFSKNKLIRVDKGVSMYNAIIIID